MLDKSNAILLNKKKKKIHHVIYKTYFGIHIRNIDIPPPHILKYERSGLERLPQLYLEVFSQNC